ncbi:hypothetical protein [Streptomyces marispadix]|uniref:Integral membrane protein n=1 Tax=Streptomyces marispadix TaxID=2922868 RepID=A0ABS9SZB6_9ACTN|nr:hypothetical protein [Streptomyces marispadix]MCH6161629.1 hypothetical protein [Streptomyces marispadix]
MSETAKHEPGTQAGTQTGPRTGTPPETSAPQSEPQAGSSTEEAESWGERVTWCLLYRGVELETAESAVAEALAHCAESGESPEQAFGTPEQYADSLAAARTPAARRAQRDYPHDLSVDDYWGLPLVAPGLVAAVGGVLVWIRNGLWVDVDAARLTGMALLAVVFSIAAVGYTLRTAGRPRAATATLAGAAAMGIPVALSTQYLPRTELVRVPSATVVLCGFLLLWLGWRTERPAEPGRLGSVYERLLTGGRAHGRSRRGGDADGSSTDGGGTDTADWLRRLEGLLRGRHRVSRRVARRIVAETEAHLESTGALPEEEFGDAEEYALTLVEEGRAPRPTKEALRWQGEAGFFVLCVICVVDADWSDPGWFEWAAAVLGVVTGVWLIRHYRDKWPEGTASSSPDEPRK